MNHEEVDSHNLLFGTSQHGARELSYQHILATVDPEQPHAQTIFRASKLAATLGARLSVVSVLPDLASLLSGSDARQAERMSRELRQNTLTSLEHLCVENDIRGATCRVLNGNPRDLIIEYAREHECDLVAVGTHNRDIGDYFLGTTATSLLHHWMGDVLGVRKRLKKHADTVVIAVDGSPATTSVLTRARQIIPDTSHVHVVFVDDLARKLDVFAGGAPNPELKAVIAEAERTRQHALTGLIEQTHFSADDLVVLRGKPGSQIKKFVASVNARLLVLGSGVHTGVGWLLGSTTNSILNEVSCDTLVVRPEA